MTARTARARAGRALVVALVAAAVFAAAPGHAIVKHEKGVANLADGAAEVVLREPLRYAIIAREADNRRLLRTRGDSLISRDQMQCVKIERVEARALVYRTEPGAPPLRLRVGMEFPGMPGFLFADTVLLEQLTYRYRAVEHVVNPDPLLVSIEGSAAVLEMETVPRTRIPPAPVHARTAGDGVGPATLDEEVLRRLRVQELSGEEYELHRGEVRVILDNAGQVLGHLRPWVLPMLSVHTGLQFKIRSGASDGVLGRQGFTVTSAKLARRIGIETGDVIVTINGRPVEGFGSLSQIYQELKRDPAVGRIDVELEREGKRLLRTYWLR